MVKRSSSTRRLSHVPLDEIQARVGELTRDWRRGLTATRAPAPEATVRGDGHGRDRSRSSRQRAAGWTVFGCVVGALLIWKLGTVGVWVGVRADRARRVPRAGSSLQTFLHPPGTIIVTDSEVTLPRGLCIAAAAQGRAVATSPRCTSCAARCRGTARRRCSSSSSATRRSRTRATGSPPRPISATWCTRSCPGSARRTSWRPRRARPSRPRSGSPG